MERHLDAAIDKVECLARDVRPERQQEIVQVITEQEPMEVGMIAEPEHEYGAETFVAYQNSKKGQVVMKQEKVLETKNKRR